MGSATGTGTATLGAAAQGLGTGGSGAGSGNLDPKVGWKCPRCQYLHRAVVPPAGYNIYCSCLGTTQKRVPNEVATIWVLNPQNQGLGKFFSTNRATLMVRI